MPRKAKRTGQLSLPVAPTWGGRRPGAGRKRTNPLVGVPHWRRPAHLARNPVHVTLRSGLPRLRDRRVFPAMRDAIASSTRPGFRVILFSVQPDHVHLVIEARDSIALASGLRGLAIRSALAVNRIMRRSGPVWKDRYHRHDMKTPREVRNGINYVLQNWKKHVEGASGVDPCSSGPWFDGWRVGAGATASTRGEKDERFQAGPPTGLAPVSKPTTWLASVGWRRHGLLSLSEMPGGARRDGVAARPRKVRNSKITDTRAGRAAGLN